MAHIMAVSLPADAVDDLKQRHVEEFDGTSLDSIQGSDRKESSAFQTCLSQTRRSIDDLLTLLGQKHLEELAQSRVREAQMPATEPAHAPAEKFDTSAIDAVVACERTSSIDAVVARERTFFGGMDDYTTMGPHDSIGMESAMVGFLDGENRCSISSEGPRKLQDTLMRTLSSIEQHRRLTMMSSVFDRLSHLFHHVLKEEDSAPQKSEHLRAKMDNVLKGQYSLLEQWDAIISQLVEDSPVHLKEGGVSLRSASVLSADSDAGSMKSKWKLRCRSPVLRPTSWRRLSWDLFSILVVLYDIAMLPMMIYDLAETDVDRAMFWFTLTFWTLDIMLSFCTGYQKEGTIEMHFKSIASRYLRGWFAIDLLTVLPDWIMLCVSGGRGSNHITRLGKAAKVLRIFRGLRLLRIFRLFRAWNGLHEHLKNQYMISIMEFTKFILVLLLMSHYSACIWYGISKVAETDGWVHEFQLQSATSLYIYLTSLYWATTQFHGSADVMPGTNLERAYAIFSVFVGLIAASVFVSSVTNLTMRMQKLHQETFLKIHKLLRYLEQNSISSDLTLRIQSFARHATDVSAMRVNEVELLKTLPPNLLTELDHEIKSLAVQSSYPLNKVVKLLPDGRKRLFLDALWTVPVSPGRHLFEDMEASGKMFILWKGKVVYRPSKYHDVQSGNATSSMQSARQQDADLSTGDKVRCSVSDPARSYRSSVTRSSVTFSDLQRSKSLTKLRSSMGVFPLMAEATDNRNTSVSVEGSRCIAEMNLWTSWHHRGDCVISGHPTIFSVKVEALGARLGNQSQYLDCDLSLAFFLANYAVHYIEWMRSVTSEELNDMSSFSVSRWRQFYKMYMVG